MKELSGDDDDNQAGEGVVGLPAEEGEAEQGIQGQPAGVVGQPGMQVAESGHGREGFDPTDGLGVVEAGVGVARGMGADLDHGEQDQCAKDKSEGVP